MFDEITNVINKLDDTTMCCPSCGLQYLHHERVEVFEREEDEVDGLHVTVKADSVSVDRLLTGNPSNRRNGIKIHFRCETCTATPILSISQHKGATYMTFE